MGRPTHPPRWDTWYDRPPFLTGVERYPCSTLTWKSGAARQASPAPGNGQEERPARPRVVEDAQEKPPLRSAPITAGVRRRQERTDPGQPIGSCACLGSVLPSPPSPPRHTAVIQLVRQSPCSVPACGLLPFLPAADDTVALASRRRCPGAPRLREGIRPPSRARRETNGYQGPEDLPCTTEPRP